MAKKILGDFLLPDEGDIIDQVAGQQEARQLKARADFLGLLAGWGFEVKKNGRGHMIRCPFHEDKTPSCSVEPEKKLFHCFGCGKKGDIIDFVRAYRGTDFSGALEVLKQSAGAVVLPGRVTPSAGLPPAAPINRPVAKKRITDLLEADTAAGIPLQSLTGKSSQLSVEPIQLPSTEQSQLPELKPRQLQTAKQVHCEQAGSPDPPQTTELRQLPDAKPLPKAAAGKTLVELVEAASADSPEVSLDTVSDYYHRKLPKSRKAMEYLQTRGLADSKLLARFRIGYCDGSLKSKASAAQHKQLQALGILRASGREHFSGYLTFPLPAANGRTVNLYGRSLSVGSPVPHLYLPGENTGIFNFKASKVYDQIILTESVIDALSLLAAGLQNVQALYGTNGFTDAHLQQLRADRVKLVVLALDNDPAGRKAAGDLAAKLADSGITAKLIYPDGKDWNDDLVACGTQPQQLTEALAAKQAAASPASQLPPLQDFTARRQGQKYIFEVGGVRYRLLGVKKAFVSSLRVNLRAEKGQQRFLDNVDLNSARSRSSLSQNMAQLFDIPEQRLENDLLAIVDWLEVERDRELEYEEDSLPELTAEEKELALELLTSPDLFARIVDDLSTLGYVGEDLNKQLIYLAASSRKMPDPISVMILSQSASGKSLLVETVRKVIPPEDVVAVSSLSDQALNYMRADGLMHKYLILGEAVHSDVVEHQIREMLSNHELSRMVTCKNEKSGQMETQIIKSEVIVSAMLSSTRYDVNPENASRCFVINTDESREQTRHIHQAQRRKYSLARVCEKQNELPAIIRQHHAAQRMLMKRTIIDNSISDYLDFPDTLMRTRRDHDRFIDLIAAVCFLRQYQKQEQEGVNPLTGELFHYIECDLTDYKIAYEIIRGILPATISSFPKGALMLYEQIRQLAQQIAVRDGLQPCEVAVSQRQIREQTSFSQMAVKRNTRLLVEYEYIRRNTNRGRGSSHTYSLIADEEIHLIDVSMIPTPEQLLERMQAGKE